MISKEENGPDRFAIITKLRNFLIRDFFKTIHCIPRGVLYSSLLLTVHYFQLFSYSFGNLDSFSYGQTEISLLFQKFCVYTKIFPLFSILSGVSNELSVEIWLVFSLCLNIIWIMLVIFQGIFSDEKEYRSKKLMMFLTTITFQLYHWILFLPTLQSCFDLILKNNNIGFTLIAILNLMLTIMIGLLNQRFETSYLFKITDYLERRPSFYFYLSFVAKITAIFIYSVKVQMDVNVWCHFFLSWLLILESVEKFSFINFITMQVYSALSCIYAYIILAYILLFYLSMNNIKTFDLAFSICICLPILIKISLNLYEYIHQKCLLLNLEKITNITVLDQAVRVIYHNIKHCKSDRNALLQIESWIIDHIRNCVDAECCCKSFLKKNTNFESNIKLKKKLTKLLLGKTLEKMLKTLKGQNSVYLMFVYLTFLIQILKVPTKSFAESLKLGEKSKKFSIADRVFTEIFIEQAYSFFEKSLITNKIKNQKLDFLKLINFEEKSMKLYEDLIKIILEYIEFYGIMSHSFIDLNQLESKITHLLKFRMEIDQTLNSLAKMNPKSMVMQEISVIFYFYIYPINQLEHQNKEFIRMKEEMNRKMQNFDLFDPDASTVSITLLKHHGVIRRHSRNFSKLLKYDTLISENISRIMPRMFSEIHTKILEKFVDEARFSLLKADDRFLFAMDKQNFVIPIRMRLKIEIFGTEDFGASAFLLPINKKFGYILASLDGRVLSINRRIFDKSFFRLVTDVSWRQLYKINLGICLPSLLFQFFGNSDNNIYEEVFDTIFVAPRSPRHDEIRIFTADFGEETERSLHSLSIDFNKNMEKSFHSQMSKSTRKNFKQDKTKILEKLHMMKSIDTETLRLYSAKVKVTIFTYEPNDLKFFIVEIQSFSGIHKNKQKIFDKYIMKLITTYEEQERADVKLFTTTQVSSLGLFAEQGFIFRDSVDSIRSSEIPDKEKFIDPSSRREEEGGGRKEEGGERREVEGKSEDVEIARKEEGGKKLGVGKGITAEGVVKEKEDINKGGSSLEGPNSCDLTSGAEVKPEFPEKLPGYTKELYFQSAPLLKRKTENMFKNEDLLGINETPQGPPATVVELENNEKEKEKTEVQQEKVDTEIKFENSQTDDLILLEEEKPEKEMLSPIIEAPEPVSKRDENKTNKVIVKGKVKKKDKDDKLTLQNQKKMKIVESISSSSENSSTKVVKKNFLHLIKSKNMPFSLKLISFIGAMGFLGLAVTFSILYSLLFVSFKDLNDNIINIMFGHHFARPLGFITKSIEQKLILEYYYSNNTAISQFYNNPESLSSSIKDYENSYLHMINMDIKFEYQYVFMRNEMNLKIYNLGQDPTKINLVLVHAFGLLIEHLRICLSQTGPQLLEGGNIAYYFLYQNSMQYMSQMIEINISTAKEATAQLDKIKTMIILFLVLAEIVVLLICLVVLPIFIQVNKSKEDALVLFCSFQQDVLISKISIYTVIYNEIVSKINDISDQYSKTLSDVSFINLIKKQRKKISISQHSKLKVNYFRIFALISISFTIISIYPFVNFITTNTFLSSFLLNINENINFGELSSSFSLFYAINYFNINYKQYIYKEGLEELKTKINSAWAMNNQIFTNVISYVSYDLDDLISSNYVTDSHRIFLKKIKSENLCELIKLSGIEAEKCSKIYKGKMKLGLIVVLKSILNDFTDLFNIINESKDIKDIENWLYSNDFYDIDMLLEFMQPITTLIIDNSVENFQYYIDLQISMITGLFIFGLSMLILIGFFGFVNLIRYLNLMLFNARFLLSVLPMDLIQENSYLLSHLSKEFKKIKL